MAFAEIACGGEEFIQGDVNHDAGYGGEDNTERRSSQKGPQEYIAEYGPTGSESLEAKEYQNALLRDPVA